MRSPFRRRRLLILISNSNGMPLKHRQLDQAECPSLRDRSRFSAPVLWQPLWPVCGVRQSRPGRPCEGRCSRPYVNHVHVAQTRLGSYPHDPAVPRYGGSSAAEADPLPVIRAKYVQWHVRHLIVESTLVGDA